MWQNNLPPCRAAQWLQPAPGWSSAERRTSTLRCSPLSMDTEQFVCSQVPFAAPGVSVSCWLCSQCHASGRAALAWLHWLLGCFPAAAGIVRHAVPGILPTCFHSFDPSVLNLHLCFYLLSFAITQLSPDLLLLSHPLRGRKTLSYFRDGLISLTGKPVYRK